MIDTEIQGAPASIEAVSAWLRDTLAPKVDSAADSMNSARVMANSSWQSMAGEEFAGSMKRGCRAADDLARAVRDMGHDLDSFAYTLRSCQDEMATVRSHAGSRGLALSGFTIHEPGAGPHPPQPPAAPDARAQSEYVQAVKAWDAYCTKVAAYGWCAAEAHRIRQRHANACRTLEHSYQPGQHVAWMLSATDIVGQGTLAGMAAMVTARQAPLHRRALELMDEAQRGWEWMAAHPERYRQRKWIVFTQLNEELLDADASHVRSKLDEAGRLIDQSRALESSRTAGVLGKASKVLGPAGVAVGAYNDYREGESFTQIAVSQGASLGAGMAAGAAMGAVCGSVVPGAGTVVGAVVGGAVGAGVAIFTDGAVDSMFEEGPDVGTAWQGGVKALTDTGDTMGSGISAGGRAIRGWFDHGHEVDHHGT